jgi:aspartate-semialdehyde dehydrogenase
MGKHVEELVVKECKASEFADCDIVFSGLDADVAGDIGEGSSSNVRDHN